MSDTKKHVLLAEDNQDVIELIQAALAESGMGPEIVYVTDGQSAVDYLFGRGNFSGRNVNEVPDLVILDLRLPHLSGLEILKQMREDIHTRHIPVVIFTSSDLSADIRICYKMGANSVVIKPIESEKFVECILLIHRYWLQWNRPHPRS